MKLARHDYIVHLLVRGAGILALMRANRLHQRTAYENSISKIFQDTSITY